VARVYVERRDFTVTDVMDATARFAQPHRLKTSTENVVSASFGVGAKPDTSTVLGPFPMAT